MPNRQLPVQQPAADLPPQAPSLEQQGDPPPGQAEAAAAAAPEQHHDDLQPIIRENFGKVHILRQIGIQ